MIEVKINGVVKWQVNEYTFVDPQMGLRGISLTVTHPSDNATVPSFVGAYVEYEGERYDIVNSKPTAEKGIDSINYKYNLIFNGQEAELQKRKIRNLATVGVDTFISQGTSFSLYADINQFKQLLENNLKYYFGSKWTINLGSTTSESVMVSVNNMFIWDLLLKTFEYYGLRWNITGNTINIGYTPDVIQHVFDYGYDGGLVKITRTAQSEPTINRLIGVGGSRNVPINYFTNRYSDFPVDPNPISGDVNIKNIMPKVFRDSVIAGTLPYIDYVEDAALVAAEGVKEDALEPNEEIYPSIAGVEVAGLGRIDQIIAASVSTADNPDDAGYSPTFDIWVKDIGFDLADNQYTATQDAKISFTSGMLAGYEFVILTTNGVRNVVVDTSKSYGGVSSKYKITLINSSEDFTATGRMLPNSVIKAMPGDSFVIHDIIMPQTYVELAELRVQNWLNEQLLIKKVEKPTYAIELTDTFFEENIAPESDGKTIREKLKSGNKLTVNNTKVTDGAQELHINNITIQYGGLLPKYSFVVTDKVSVQGSAIARLTNEIQKTDNSVRDTNKKIVKLQQYSDRQWKEIQETITLLGAAIDGFSTGINPITVQTMQLLVGNESLQFRFVSSKTTPVAVSHAFNWDDVLKSFTTTSGIIQHMTLGITEISSNHPVSAYKFWDIASYSNNTLVAEKPYYLYAKCSRTTSGAVFLLSDVPIGMYDDANYYYFLTGILNSENSDGGRSFVSLYGFTEILPGRITTDKIVSSDGLTYFDLLNGVIGGKIRFASTGGGETSLADWADGTSQDIQDAQAAANAAALAAQQAIDDAAANVGLINTEVAKLQAQIDGEVSNWFYPYSPTLANYPASEWTTNEIKDRHIGDTFTNTAQAPATDAGKSWRFVKNGTVYSWTQIADSDAVLALQKAAQAQSTADGKSTTYLIQPTSYKLGDMWVLAADQTVNGVAYKSGEILTATQDSETFVQSHWLKRVRYTDDTAVDKLEIGGRNYTRNFNSWGNANTITAIIDGGNTALVSLANQNMAGAITSNIISRKGRCVVSVNVKTTDVTKIYIDGRGVILKTTHDQYRYDNLYYNLPANFNERIVIYLNYGNQVNNNWYIGIAEDSVAKSVELSNPVLVIGDKIIDWSPAPEDVQASIETAKTEADTARNEVNSLNTYVDGAFKDGVIDEAEAKAIEKYKNTINETMAKAEASFAKVFANTYLEGAAKTALENAKINLWGQRDTLLSTVNTAIADGKTTIAEKNAVDSAFNTFNSLMSAFQSALEEANKAIQAKLDNISKGYVDNFQIGKNLFRGKNGRPLSLGGAGTTPPAIELVQMDTPFGNEAYKITFPANNNIGFAGSRAQTNSIQLLPLTTYSFSTYVYSPDDNLSGLAIYPTGSYGLPTLFREAAKDIDNWRCYNREGVVTPNVEGVINELLVYYANTVFASQKVFYVAGVKFEQRDKTSYWSPAPEDVQAEIDGIEIGGRNLLLDSGIVVTNANYNRQTLSLSTPTIIGQAYTFSLKCDDIGDAILTIYDYTTVSVGKGIGRLNRIGSSNVFAITFKAVDAFTQIRIRNTGDTTVPTSTYAAKLEKGIKATDWSPAPEDVQAEIDAEKNRINDILSDNVADPSEKQYLSNLWQEIYAEYPRIWAQANDYSVDKSNYEAKYTALNNLLSPVLANLTVNTTVSGASIRTAFSEYYDAKTFLLNNITNKVNATAADAQVKANALDYLKQALQGSAEISGGLVGTNVILLKTLAGLITGGLSGLANDNIGFWTGGTYQDALDSLAEIILRKDGSGQLAGGDIAFAPGKPTRFRGMIELLSSLGKVGVIDSGLVTSGGQISEDVLETLAQLAAGYSVSITPQSSWTDSYVAGILGEYAHAYTQNIVVTEDSSLEFWVSFGRTYTGWNETYDIYVENVNTGVLEYTRRKFSSTRNFVGGNYSIPVRAGTYKIHAKITGTGGFQLDQVLSVTLEGKNQATNITAVGFRQKTKIGVDGFFSYWGEDNYLYYQKDIGFKAKSASTKWDTPGVLAAGSVAANGAHANVWGAKSKSAGAALITGGFRVPLSNMTHSSYVVQITPHTTATLRIGAKTSSNFEVLGTGGFDYVVIGKN